MDSVGLVPTGSTLLNLACNDNWQGAFPLGTLHNVIGDSSAGKTMLCLTILAEMSQRKEFDGHRFIFDAVERRLFFNIPKLFGQKLADRIEGPDGAVGESASTTIESFYYGVDTLLKKKIPFIYILDSMDALTSVASEKKFLTNKKAYEKEESGKGSYGDGKAKTNSELLRPIAQKLRDTNSLLIIISQTRDNIGISFAQKTRAGGRALEFYASHVMWLAKTGKIKKTVRGKPRTVGVNVRAKLSKNSSTGKQVEVDFPLFYSYGLDDMSSMFDYLLSEGEFRKQGKEIVTPFGTGSETALIKQIEEAGQENEVRKLCQRVWMEIGQQMELRRKPKYE